VADKYDRVEPVLVDVVQRPDHVGQLVEAADLVVSLLPFQLHHLVAEKCIENRTHMVTASYCTLEMMRMHDKYVLLLLAVH
jgi:alpha-aminoadipic semialdehyde synthase